MDSPHTDYPALPEKNRAVSAKSLAVKSLSVKSFAVKSPAAAVGGAV
jgi:hypothetical protein